MTTVTGKTMPRFKLWLAGPDNGSMFGDGKWRLLKAILKHGSLRAAAHSLGMSYRKAWGDLAIAEDSIGERFVERKRGGPAGGKTSLTDQGRIWIDAYSLFRTEIERAVSESYRRHIQPLIVDTRARKNTPGPRRGQAA